MWTTSVFLELHERHILNTLGDVHLDEQHVGSVSLSPALRIIKLF